MGVTEIAKKCNIPGRDGGVAYWQYLIYFEDGEPDEFYYCLDDDDFGVTYHRFTKEDYIDFGF